MFFLFASCAVIRRPGGTTDSTIITRDSGSAGEVYRKRQVHIEHASEYTIRPMFWYVIGVVLAATTFLIIRNNK